MSCPNCGNDRFYAHQVCYLDIIVNGNNNFEDNQGGSAEAAIYEAGHPYGPYTCTKCRAEFEELPEVKEECTKV